MKKIVCFAIIALLVLSMSSVASARKFSIGVLGGVNIPIAQCDAKSGALFGAKGRIPLLPFLAVEPNFIFAKYAGKDMEYRDTLSFSSEGGDFTSFGVDLLVGTMSSFSKMKFYGLVGMNSNTYKRKGEGFTNKTGFGLTIGTGFEFFPTEILSVELRARYHAIKIEEGGKAQVEISGGLNYYFGKE